MKAQGFELGQELQREPLERHFRRTRKNVQQLLRFETCLRCLGLEEVIAVSSHLGLLWTSLPVRPCSERASATPSSFPGIFLIPGLGRADPHTLTRLCAVSVKLDPPSGLQSNVSSEHCVLTWSISPALEPLATFLSYELAFKRQEEAWEVKLGHSPWGPSLLEAAGDAALPTQGALTLELRGRQGSEPRLCECRVCVCACVHRACLCG